MKRFHCIAKFSGNTIEFDFKSSGLKEAYSFAQDTARLVFGLEATYLVSIYLTGGMI